MGGSSKKQTVGYKYYLGMHMILCHGPVDKIRDIRVDGRVAWQGDYAGGRININADNLFGGKKREGGISGAVDFETGHSTQARNDYLQSKLGSAIPAFRGVVGLVLRQCYLGINPYLKRWSVRLQRIHVRQDGLAQWYDGKSQIGSLWKEHQAIYIALDVSGSMNEMMSNGKTRWENTQEATLLTLDYIDELRQYSNVGVDIKVVGWSGPDSPLATADFRNVGSAGIASIKASVASWVASGYTDIRLATALAPAFFAGAPVGSRKTSMFVTDGMPNINSVTPPLSSPEVQAAITAEAAASLFSTSGVHAFGFNIDLADTTYTSSLDNSAGDGVPVLDGSSPDTMKNALVFALSGQLDMNPAHIIRECLTDPGWGMGYQDADVDEESFVAAADRLYSEAMGISLLWDRQIPIEDFVTEIVRHINAALYVDRISGKFKLKLIRADFDDEDLLVLGEDEIDRVDGYSRPAFGEMVNSVTVNFWDAGTGKTSSVTAQDTALIQLQGSVIGTTLQYPGFTNHRIATQVAMRNLQAMSFPLLSCTIYANRAAASLNIGDAFRFEWPDYHDGYIVMRVTGMALGDGRKNSVRITCLQDVFSLPETAAVSAPDDEWVDPSAAPVPADYRVVTEAPYYELVQRLGQTQTDTLLASNADAGFVLASAARPSGAINATLMVDAGAGYEDRGVVEFSPAAFLAAAVGPGDTVLPITGGDGLDEIRIGSHAQLGAELVRIDVVTSSALTVGRGVLDTVPVAHAAGAALIAWDDFAEGDSTEYAAGESLNVKLLPASGGGVVNLVSAAADNVTLAQRALRPYPPGKLLVNAVAYPVAIGGIAELSLAWSHRDRLQQTAGELQDTTVGNIGPEAGTAYNLRIYGEAETLLREVLDAGVSYTYLTADELADSLLPAASSDLYWSYVSSLLRFDGANNAQVFPDETGVVWTYRRNAKISTAQAKFDQSLNLSPFVDTTSTGSAVRLHLHFVGVHGSTTILESAFDQTVTAVGNAALSTTQSVFLGSSLYLDGTGDYLTVADPTSQFNFSNFFFTIECRVRFDDVTLNQTIACSVDLQAAPSKGWVLRYDPTQATPGFRLVLFTATGLSDTFQISWLPVVHTFYKIEVSRTSSTLVRFFVNGVQIGTGTIVNAGTVGNSGRSLLIGAQDAAGAPALFFKGYIDEFRIKFGGTPNAANYTPETEPFPSRYWGDYIESTSSAAFGFGTGDFSIACWAYVSGSSLNHVILDVIQSLPQVSTHYCLFYIDAVTLKLTVAMNGAVLGSGGSAVPSATWSYVEFCRAAGVLYAFIDGVLQFTLPSTHDLGTVGVPRVGHSWRSASGFAGHLDDLEITKGHARHTAGYTPPVVPHPSGGGGGFRLNGKLRVVLESERDSIISLQAHDYTVLREGYGFNYGELYGGA